jgi:hypothetical protein
MIEHFRQGQRSWTWRAFRTDFSGIADWAAAKGQTSALLKRAIDALEEGSPHRLIARAMNASQQGLPKPPTWQQAVLADHLHLRDVLTGDKDPSEGGLSLDTWRMQLAYIAHQLPWERERAIVLLRRISVARYDAADHFTDALANRDPYASVGSFLPLTPEELLQSRKSREQYAHMEVNIPLETTFLLRGLCLELPSLEGVVVESLPEVQQREAVLLQLILLAYRLEHGSYPSVIYELDEEVSRVPSDLFWQVEEEQLMFGNRPFNYHPDGLDGWLELSDRRIRPGTPFFWSGGQYNAMLTEIYPDRLQIGSDAAGSVTRWHDLEGPPVYTLTLYGSNRPDPSALVYLLPVSDETGDTQRKGRRPEEDNVGLHRPDFGLNPFSMIFSRSYVGGLPPEEQGLPPGYYLPPLE